jgi:hypothetical protein
MSDLRFSLGRRTTEEDAAAQALDTALALNVR